MRLVAVSDTHLEYLKMKIPDGDVFIHAGDIACNRSAPQQFDVNKSKTVKPPYQ